MVKEVTGFRKHSLHIILFPDMYCFLIEIKALHENTNNKYMYALLLIYIYYRYHRTVKSLCVRPH